MTRDEQPTRRMIGYVIDSDTPLSECRRCKRPVYRVVTGSGFVQADPDAGPHKCPDLKRTHEVPTYARASTCKSDACGARIYWIETRRGRDGKTVRLPVDPDGGSHFQTCLDVRQITCKANAGKGKR